MKACIHIFIICHLRIQRGTKMLLGLMVVVRMMLRTVVKVVMMLVHLMLMGIWI